MIELIGNMIAVTALAGTLAVMVLVIFKAVIALAAAGSTTLSRPAAVSQKACRYCGAVLAGDRCEYCGAVNQAKPKP